MFLPWWYGLPMWLVHIMFLFAVCIIGVIAYWYSRWVNSHNLLAYYKIALPLLALAYLLLPSNAMGWIATFQ